MTTPVDSKRAWFDEIIQQYLKRENDIVSTLSDRAAFRHWTSDRAAVDALISSPYRDKIVEGIRVLVRNNMLLFFDSLMAGFDGATPFAAQGHHLQITDQDGRGFGDHIQSDFMEHLVDKGLE